MSATWGDDPKPPIVIHISVAQKAAIVARTPRMLITFDLASGDFSIRPMEYIRFRVLQHPDLIHPRELTTVPEDAEKKGLIDLGWFGSLDDPIPPKPPTR